jgi:hypothetical protein
MYHFGWQSDHGCHLGVVQDVTHHSSVRTCPFLRTGILPPATRNNVFNTVNPRKTPCDVAAWSQTITIDRTSSEDGIVSLIAFGGKKDRWPEAANEKGEVKKEMKFRL